MSVYQPNSLIRYVDLYVIVCIDIYGYKFDNPNRIVPEALAYFVLANKKWYFVTNQIKNVKKWTENWK